MGMTRTIRPELTGAAVEQPAILAVTDRARDGDTIVTYSMWDGPVRYEHRVKVTCQTVATVPDWEDDADRRAIDALNAMRDG